MTLCNKTSNDYLASLAPPYGDYSCEQCDETFPTIVPLCAHTMSYHKSGPPLSLYNSPHLTPCSTPSPLTMPQVDGNYSPSLTSVSNSPLLAPCNTFPPIPQVDGIHSPCLPSVSNANQPAGPSSLYQTSAATGPTSTPSVSVTRHAPWALNRKKQLLRLHQDTFIPDYTVTVSPNCQNAIIQCSTGFYTKVALPSLCDIKIGSRFDVESEAGNVNVHCFDITGEIDNSEANVKAVAFFRLENNKKLSKGGVTMHLHHTKRKLQFQGGALMPDKSKSPVWFVQNVISERFKRLAKNKSFDVNYFNQTIRDLVSRQSNIPNSTCASCHIQFTGRSQPELCWQCSKSFHKKCLQSKLHHCQKPSLILPTTDSSLAPSTTTLASTTASQAITQPLPRSSLPQGVFTNGLPSSAASHQLLSDISSTNSDIPTSNSLPSGNTHNVPHPDNNSGISAVDVSVQSSFVSRPNLHQLSSQPFHQPGVTSMSLPNTSGPIPAPNHQASSRPPASSQTTASSKPKPVKKSLKNTPAIDISSFNTECLKKQLNIAHAKIQEVESELEKTKNTKYILEERIKLFEATNNKDIFEKYFPSQSSDPGIKCSHQPVSSCSNLAHHCCAPPPCSSYRCHDPGSDDLMKVVKELSRKVTQLTYDIIALKDGIRSNVTPTPPTPIVGIATNSHYPAPLSPDIVVIEHDQSSPNSDQPPDLNDLTTLSEANTIDDNVPNDVPHLSLNSQAPTTQLHQLGHSLDISQQ